MAEKGSAPGGRPGEKTRRTTTVQAPVDRKRISQTEVPGATLEEALRVPRAIIDNYASKATPPLRVASAMKMQPNAGPFRRLCGAAIAYGLTAGGPNAPNIEVLPLATRVFRPLEEGDDLKARREALLKPRVVGEFLRRYAGSPLPRNDIGQNVLVDLGVPTDRAGDVLQMILEGAELVGLITTIKDKKYVDLSGTGPSIAEEPIAEAAREGVAPSTPGERAASQSPLSSGSPLPSPSSLATVDSTLGRRVFVTHGKNKAFIDPIRKLLVFGGFEAVVSVERESVAQPVPDKVMGDMRTCGAGIIHVDAELRLMDAETKEHIVLNSNVLIEIGAAMALYGRRIILIVREGIQLPSNLQGLYEVRYKGDGLDSDATIRLLGAINDIKNHPVPERGR